MSIWRASSCRSLSFIPEVHVPGSRHCCYKRYLRKRSCGYVWERSRKHGWCAGQCGQQSTIRCKCTSGHRPTKNTEGNWDIIQSLVCNWAFQLSGTELCGVGTLLSPLIKFSLTKGLALLSFYKIKSTILSTFSSWSRPVQKSTSSVWYVKMPRRSSNRSKS